MKISIQQIIKDLKFTRQNFYEFNTRYCYFKRTSHGIYSIKEELYRRIKDHFFFKAKSKLRNSRETDKRKASTDSLRGRKGRTSKQNVLGKKSQVLPKKTKRQNVRRDKA